MQSEAADGGSCSGIAVASQRCSITHDRVESPNDVMCTAQPHRTMLTALVYLEDYIGHDMWCDSRRIVLPFQSEGMVGIYDRSHRWHSVIRRPLHCVQFHFPKSRLDRMMGGTEGKGVVLLDGLPARLSLFDPLLKYLALASLPLMQGRGQSNTSYAEQVMDAVIGHVARTYCRLTAKSTFDRDRLVPWQIRKINTLVSSNIEGRLTVDELATVCALSPSHFTYLFKNTTGCTPHQWLLNRRIELAKRLLVHTDEPLASIASASGFSDQSHFTRVFSRRMKASPSAWRRAEGARMERVPVDGLSPPLVALG